MYKRQVFYKAHQAGQVDLAVLTFKEFFQIVIAQRRIFDINFAHHADLDPVSYTHLEAAYPRLTSAATACAGAEVGAGAALPPAKPVPAARPLPT